MDHSLFYTSANNYFKVKLGFKSLFVNVLLHKGHLSFFSYQSNMHFLSKVCPHELIIKGSVNLTMIKT